MLNSYDGKSINIYRTFDKKSFSYDIAQGILSEDENRLTYLMEKAL